MAGRRTCVGCAREVSQQTILRHVKNGCGQRRHESRLRKAAKAALTRARRAGLIHIRPPPPPLRPSRHYHCRYPPRGPSPQPLLDRIASRSPPPDPGFGFPDGSPEVKHPDFQFDTLGAGLGLSSLSSSPQFTPPLPLDEYDDDTPITYHDRCPWINKLNAEEYIAREFLAQLVRTKGKLVLSI